MLSFPCAHRSDDSPAWRRGLLVFTAVLLGILPATLRADPASSPDELPRTVARLLSGLDNDREFERQVAVQELDALAARPESAAQLSSLLRTALVQPQTSLEVRTQLRRVLEKLPAAETLTPPEATLGEIHRLVEQLDADSYDDRRSAAARLKWLLRDNRHAVTVMHKLKNRLADPDLPTDSRGRLEAIWQAARQSWLLSDPATWKLPPVTAAQANAWIDQLCRPLPAEDRRAARIARDAAERELRDLLCRDDMVPALRKALEARQADPLLDVDSAGRIGRLYDLSRPGLIAECWAVESSENGYIRKQLVVQHLIAGVPQHAPGSERATHFDFIDDKRAHCVSGNTLSPNTNYPVHRAIPHPQNPGFFFHLIHCYTPRIRLVYELRIDAQEQERLAELSFSTCEAWLAEKHVLKRNELLMLPALAPEVVSSFAGRYFLAVNDQPLDDDAGMHSVHTELCRALMEYGGTKRVMPGLAKALADGRIKPAPAGTVPLNYPWVLALHLARSDPWPEADEWLADQIGRTDALYFGGTRSPEVGATAASILLERHKRNLADFQLEQVLETPLDDHGFFGYRFTAPEGRKAVERWWQKREPAAEKTLP